MNSENYFNTHNNHGNSTNLAIRNSFNNSQHKYNLLVNPDLTEDFTSTDMNLTNSSPNNNNNFNAAAIELSTIQLNNHEKNTNNNIDNLNLNRSPIRYPSKTGCSRIIPGPSSLRNILSCELCERYSYYALRACLVIYLTDSLGFSEPTSISLYSYFTAAAYFVPLFGGYISDSFLGKYYTIMSFSSIYTIGAAILALTSLVNSIPGAMIGLCLIAIGTGGIKPCVSSFGADQYTGEYSKTVSPAQLEQETSQFFHVFYFSINLGSVFSFGLTPVLRHYFGFGIAFGVPGLLLLVSVLSFWLARNQYVIIPPQGSVLQSLYRTYKQAWKLSKSHRSTRKKHWLDYATPDDSKSISPDSIANAKSLYRVVSIISQKPKHLVIRYIR